MNALDPVNVINSFDAAANNHNVFDVMDLFSDDSEIRLEPPPPPPDREVYRGEQEIRDWLHGLFQEGLHIRAHNFQVRGNEVTWQSDISADRYRKMGIDPVNTSNKAVLWGALIRSMTLTFSPETVQKMKQAAAQPGLR
jgi:hypothetical protein